MIGCVLCVVCCVLFVVCCVLFVVLLCLFLVWALLLISYRLSLIESQPRCMASRPASPGPLRSAPYTYGAVPKHIYFLNILCWSINRMTITEDVSLHRMARVRGSCRLCIPSKSLMLTARAFHRN